MDRQFVKLAGVTFENCQENIKRFGGPGMSYNLVREDNPHDPNAIKVMLFDEYMLGYLPKWFSKQLAPLMDQGCEYTAWFVSLNTHDQHDTVGMTVRILPNNVTTIG